MIDLIAFFAVLSVFVVAGLIFPRQSQRLFVRAQKHMNFGWPSSYISSPAYIWHLRFVGVGALLMILIIGYTVLTHWVR